MKQQLSLEVVNSLAVKAAGYIFELVSHRREVKAYAIPRGGIPAAYLIQNAMWLNHVARLILVETPEEAEVFIDDIIDSGRTKVRYCTSFPNRPFVALIDKTGSEDSGQFGWVVFPWESAVNAADDSIVGTITNRIKQAGAPYLANDNIAAFIEDGELTVLQEELQHRAEHFLRGLVIDIEGDHNTVDTAKRIAKMYLNEVFRGRYTSAPKITDFPNAKKLDEMYLTGPITIRSACSHHFVPILGRCWIGIIPGDRVIGLSKFNRIVEWIAARPQIQEELVVQIADFIEEQIHPTGLAVIIEASHMCMSWRGVREPMEAKMTTSVMRGSFRDKPEARAEFLALVTK